MTHTCPWPTEGETLHWECNPKGDTMTSYRDRHLAGVYDPTKPESKAKAEKAAATRATKSTTTKPKRSSK
jgi:hypothetical protein